VKGGKVQTIERADGGGDGGKPKRRKPSTILQRGGEKIEPGSKELLGHPRWKAGGTKTVPRGGGRGGRGRGKLFGKRRT